MGRRKIQHILDDRKRQLTFQNRKAGLMKKAMELSILCNCQISLVIFNDQSQLYEYCSADPQAIWQQYTEVEKLPHERRTNSDYDNATQPIPKQTGEQITDEGSSNAPLLPANANANNKVPTVTPGTVEYYNAMVENGSKKRKNQSSSDMEEEPMAKKRKLDPLIIPMPIADHVTPQLDTPFFMTLLSPTSPLPSPSTPSEFG